MAAIGKIPEDPAKIPVKEIVEEWRSQTKRGRYESAMWRAAGLEEPGAPPPAPAPATTAATTAAAATATTTGNEDDDDTGDGDTDDFFAQFIDDLPQVNSPQRPL